MVSHWPRLSASLETIALESQSVPSVVAGPKKMKQTLAFMRMVCQKLPRILNQKLMKTEKTSVAPEATAAKQAWAAPTFDCLSVSMDTTAVNASGMDGNASSNT